MKKAKLNNLKWWGIDFDGTICISDPKDGYKMIEPFPNTKDVLERIRKVGKKIVVYTARGWEHYIEVEEFMNKYDLPFDLIVCGKLLVEVMIDDRAINFNGDWKKAFHDACLKTT